MTDDAAEPGWDQALLRRLAEAREIVIETERRSGERRRTIIWIVADDHAAYVRSVRGDDGWWYRDVLARPNATLALGAEGVRVRAVPASDAEAVELVSGLLREKYGRTQRASTAAMLQPHTLPTTLRLDPA